MRTRIRKLRDKKKRGTQIRALRFLLSTGSLIIFIHHTAGKADRVEANAGVLFSGVHLVLMNTKPLIFTQTQPAIETPQTRITAWFSHSLDNSRNEHIKIRNQQVKTGYKTSKPA